jgi:hypothetical protein
MARLFSDVKTFFSTSPENLVRDPRSEVLPDDNLSEDFALSLLKRGDLTPEALEMLSKNAGVMKSRKVKLALLAHPHTPRHVAMPMLRHLFTFDLMQAALLPIIPADVKKAADEILITRLESISYGERLTLARRASGRVAGQLLQDKEARVIRAALDNARLTEAAVVKALKPSGSQTAFVEAVCRHAKWSVRREVRIALLRNEKTPLARALEYAQSLPPPMVRQVLQNSRLPQRLKACLGRQLEQRSR